MRAAGYFSGVMGTGEHSRQLVAALRAAGVRLRLTTLHPDAAPEDENLSPPDDEGEPETFSDFNLLCANADVVRAVAQQLGSRFFDRRYTIGFWAWEVAEFPARFDPAFEVVDEVWVGSRHVRDAIVTSATVPVVAVPQPVSLPENATDTPSPSWLPRGFLFLFAFDYLSVFERKNPVAVVRAFASAFPPGSGAKLIIKSLNDSYARAHHDELRAAVEGHPDVCLVERRLTHEERNGLVAAIDCYVSLHRAEGFGYTLAEAMWLGKPVIATGYSGNLDFMTSENSYLVDYRLTTIGRGNDPYPPDGQWAEPEVQHAARLMRHVFEHHDEARRRGMRAASEIRRSHGLVAAGGAMRSRLDKLADERAAGPRFRFLGRKRRR